MKSLQNAGFRLLWFPLVAGVLARCFGVAQVAPDASASPSDSAVAVIRSVKIVAGKEGPAVEIYATRPLAASAQKLDRPPRLVIDLYNTSFSLTRQRFAV